MNLACKIMGVLHPINCNDGIVQVKMNVKPIGAFKSGLIRQVVFERRGLKIQGPLYYVSC